MNTTSSTKEKALGTSNAKYAKSSAKPNLGRRFLGLFARGSAVTTIIGVLIVVLATALATTVGVVAVHALGITGSGPSSGTDSSQSGGTTANSPSAVLATGPDQSHAPAFPTNGGVQPGYGNFNGLTCISTSQCLAVGADNNNNGVTSLSSNGGVSWNNSAMPAGTPPLDAISCGDANQCVAVGQGAIVSTSNGGASWTLSAVPVANTTLIGASCPTASICVASGVTETPFGPYTGAIVRSTDGGNTWTAATLPASTFGIGDVVCPNAKQCIAIGASVLESNDGGVTWASETVPGGIQSLRTIACSSSTTCVAVGPVPPGPNGQSTAADAIITTDGGNTWAQDPFPAGSNSVEEISCSTSTQCFAGGSSQTSGGPAVFYSTSNAGATWSVAATAPSGISTIAGLSCPAANDCAVVGRQANRQAATSASSDATNWSTSVLPDTAVPPASDAVLPSSNNS
jgi:photosystem II stability/assembly factor-like uncharacterized protein